MKQNLAQMGEPDYGFATVARFTPNTAYEGKTIPEISAAMKGRPAGLDDEIETIFDLMNAGGASMIYRLMGDVDIERIMRYPVHGGGERWRRDGNGRGQSASRGRTEPTRACWPSTFALAACSHWRTPSGV